MIQINIIFIDDQQLNGKERNFPQLSIKDEVLSSKGNFDVHDMKLTAKL